MSVREELAILVEGLYSNDKEYDAIMEAFALIEEAHSYNTEVHKRPSADVIPYESAMYKIEELFSSVDIDRGEARKILNTIETAINAKFTTATGIKMAYKRDAMTILKSAGIEKTNRIKIYSQFLYQLKDTPLNKTRSLRI